MRSESTGPGRLAARPPVAPLGNRARRLWMQIGVLTLVQFVGMMSGTIIATALPAITQEIDGTTLHYTWMFVTTALASAVTTPLWGRLGDLFDAKTVLQWSLGFYTAGALLCGLAPTADLLIAARVVQGIGIGGHIALTQALAARLVAPRQRAQVNGVMAVSQIVATVSGPLVGALLVGVPDVGWRLCFLLGVPVAVVAAIIVQIVLPGALSPAQGRVDYLGAVLLVVGLTGLLGWISFVGDELPVFGAPSLLWLGTSLIVLGVAAWWEWRAKDAIVPLRALSGRVSVIAAVASLCVGVSMFGGTIFVTQYLQLGRGLDAMTAGILLMPMAAATFVCALLVGRLSTRSGRIRRYLRAGVALILLGNAALIPLTPSTPLWWVVSASALIGAGLGMTVTNLILVAQNATRLRDTGAVSGTIIFCRTLGSTVGLALFGAIVASYVPAVDAVAPADLPQLYAHGSATVFLVASGISLLGLIAVLLLPPITLRSTADLDAPAPVTA